jgi:hypothetical protein
MIDWDRRGVAGSKFAALCTAWVVLHAAKEWSVV